MAQSIPQWLLGQHLTAITVTGLIRAANGDVTEDGEESISGYIEGVELEPTHVLGMFPSVERPSAHYEVLLDDFDLRIVEIKRKSTAANPSVLNNVYDKYSQVKVVFTAADTWTCYGTIAKLRDGVVNYGKNTMELLLKPADMVVAGSPLSFTPAS